MQEKNVQGGALARTLISIGIVFGIFIFFLVFTFAFGVPEEHKSHTVPVVADATAAPGQLAFTAPAYEVEVKQEIDMNQYLNAQGVSANDVAWSVDSGKAVVGSNGRIVVRDYGVRCQLTAKDKNDADVYSTCQIQTRTAEDDLAYRVRELNGVNQMDTDNNGGNVNSPDNGAGGDGVVTVSADRDESRTIDVDEIKRQPAKRSTKYKWNRKLFYKLEDASEEDDTDNQINTYIIEKKQFQNKDTRNEMEYEIYKNPDSKKIHKIVSIEKKRSTLEMTEYYFTDNKKVNFIYRYENVNYVPTYAKIAEKGERYMFHKDTMVNWRIVDSGGQRNYCYGGAEKRELRGHPGIREYSKLSQKKKKRYDKMEKLMLNCAYNTYEKVTKYEGVSSIRGYVSDGDGSGISNAAVNLRSSQYDKDLFSGTTDKNGYYEIFVPARESIYEIGVSGGNYKDEKLYNIEMDTDRIGIYQETVYMVDKAEGAQSCTLNLYDALNKNENGAGMQPLTDADVEIMRGVNNFSGRPVTSTRVEDDNVLYLELDAGMYTVHVTRKDYVESYCSLFVSAETDNEADIFVTPKLGKRELRIVLTWGSTPPDLDSHLFVPLKSGGYERDNHVGYYHMEISDGSAALDVDDTDGYGPETTSIYDLERGQYKFYVADYTNCCRNNEKSSEMSNSSAVVRVYGAKGLLQTFYVPVNRKGVLWEVFEIRDRNIIPIQRYYDTIGDKTWWSSNNK